jgi:hypothetical protein
MGLIDWVIAMEFVLIAKTRTDLTIARYMVVTIV